ncbi:MAG: hypothetical protein IIA14_06100 [SAR324 cluster bacterium]|nr:hypothetical protein [SAR324 cluster bacterium]
MRKVIAVFRRGFDSQAKPLAEILLAILPLVRNMRRVINHHIKNTGLKRHPHIISDQGRLIVAVNIHPDKRKPASSPKSRPVHGGVQNSLGSRPRIEIKKQIQKLGILPGPKGGQRLVGFVISVGDETFAGRLHRFSSLKSEIAQILSTSPASIAGVTGSVG